MKVYFLRGNPIALVIVSIAMSGFTFAWTLVCFIKKISLNMGIVPFILFSTLYSSICVIAFYLAYKKERGNRPFMSPVKYNKAIKQNEKYEKDIQKLRLLLKNCNSNYSNLNDDKLIETVVEILSAGINK